MKKNILLASTLLLMASVNAQNIKISNSDITEKDNSVTVSFSATLGHLSSNEKLTITPVVYSSLGTQTLRPIVVVGRGRAISDKRIGESQSHRYTKGETIPYTITLPYEAWMGEVSLRIDSKILSCCTEKQLASYDVITPKLIHYDIEPNFSSEKAVKEPTELEKYDNTAAYLYHISDYESRHETMKSLREEGALKVYFRQSNTVIDSTFMDNNNVLTQVRNVIDLIQADTTATLDKIVILGLTSPEGNLSHNAKIAAKRAESLKNYLNSRFKNLDNLFEIIPADEDWDGLVKLVEASDMQYKQEVLDIIAKYDVLNGREKHLMDLKWGRPYNYMLEHFFPLLRNAGYIQIYYESKPDTSVSTLNSAIDLINNKQWGDALETLRTLKDDARVNNLRGVAFMMMEDYTQAEVYLNKAAEQGSEDATKNLKEMQTRQSVNK